jgi:hypothetical protein
MELGAEWVTQVATQVPAGPVIRASATVATRCFMKHEEPRFDRMFSLRLLVGLWIIALGAIFLAGNLGWIDARHVLRHFWPFIFILAGTGMLAQPHNRRRQRWAWVLIGIGECMFADKIRWIGLSLCLAFWGGIEIYVPKDWTVTSNVATFMGGFIDKRRPTTTAPTKTLVITGLVIMSGVEVKN